MVPDDISQAKVKADIDVEVKMDFPAAFRKVEAKEAVCKQKDGIENIYSSVVLHSPEVEEKIGLDIVYLAVSSTGAEASTLEKIESSRINLLEKIPYRTVKDNQVLLEDVYTFLSAEKIYFSIVSVREIWSEVGFSDH